MLNYRRSVLVAIIAVFTSAKLHSLEYAELLGGYSINRDRTAVEVKRKLESKDVDADAGLKKRLLGQLEAIRRTADTGPVLMTLGNNECSYSAAGIRRVNNIVRTEKVGESIRIVIRPLVGEGDLKEVSVMITRLDPVTLELTSSDGMVMVYERAETSGGIPPKNPGAQKTVDTP